MHFSACVKTALASSIVGVSINTFLLTVLFGARNTCGIVDSVVANTTVLFSVYTRVTCLKLSTNFCPLGQTYLINPCLSVYDMFF